MGHYTCTEFSTNFKIIFQLQTFFKQNISEENNIVIKSL